MDVAHLVFAGILSPFDSRSATSVDAGKEIPYSACPPFLHPSPMIVSKLTSKAQTTIPQPVRAALDLQPGDEIAYEIVDDRVIVTKVHHRGKTDDPFRTFEEWSSEADANAYANL